MNEKTQKIKILDIKMKLLGGKRYNKIFNAW